MGFGVLTKQFTIVNDVYKINIPRGLEVRFGVVNGTPTVTFNPNVRLIRVDGSWFAEVYGCLMRINFNPAKPLPYPVSYFK